MVKKLPEARPGKVTVVDLADWVNKLPPGEDARLRTDGVHFQTPATGPEDTSTEVAKTYLGPAILDAWRAQWKSNRTDDIQAGPPVPLLVLGDDTASRIGEGLAGWSDSGQRFNVTNGAIDGCGIGVGGSRLNANQRERVPDACADPMQRYLTALFNSSAQTAVLTTSLWDVTDRQLPGDPTWRAPGDPLYDAWLQDQIAQSHRLPAQQRRAERRLAPHPARGSRPRVRAAVAGVEVERPHPRRPAERLDQRGRVDARLREGDRLRRVRP